MATRHLKISDIAEACGDIDIFICSASFEARCLSIATALDATRVKRALIAENMNHVELHGEKPSQLLGLFANSQVVALDTNNPLQTADAISECLNGYLDSNSLSILIDVTAFTHEAVLILFRMFVERFPKSRLAFAYSKAAEYSIGDPIEQKWLSRGVTELRSVLGYPGGGLPSLGVHFIALVGFEHERIIELIRAIEPSVISLGYSDMGPNEEPAHRKSNEYGLQIIQAVYGAARTFTFPVHDPIGTLSAIQRQVDALGDYNTVLAPMNTKISTLGAGLAGLMNPDIQLCYAQALVYNVSCYSTPGDEAFLFSIDNPSEILEASRS